MPSIASWKQSATAGDRFDEVVLGKPAAPFAPTPGGNLDHGDAFLAFQVPAESESVGLARRMVGTWISARSTSESLENTMLVVSELVTNAVHAAPGSMLLITAELTGLGELVLEVWDSAPPPAALTPREPALDDEGGRGLLLAFELATVDLVSVPNGTLVRARMAVAA